jgi:hypothetical protein
MAIVQISKIQQRSGNLVDLPQLDDAEFGWASDDRRLFIGGGPSHGPENVEVLTSYSNISFSQINGSDQGNFNISNAENGQVLTYISDTNTWENYPSTSITDANTNFKLNLGDVSHLRMDGGAIGYVLETDGQGNVSWTPKGTLYTPIIALSNATPIIMTVANTVPYTNGTAITISGANGANANSIVNGQTFYITLATDFATSGNVRLYTDSGRTIAANGTNLGPSTPNVGIATSVVGSAGGGASASGSNTTIQFNTNNLLDGVSGFTFDKVNYTMTVTNGTSGNIISKTINATSSFTGPVFISNTATGTAPLTVSSTTRVANLNVSYANVSDFEVVTTSNSGTFYPVFVSGNTTANYALASNANIAVNAATGNLSATILNANGNVIGGNIITTGYVSTPVVQNGNSNITIDANANINMFVSGNANARVVATATGLNVAGIVTASTLVSNV